MKKTNSTFKKSSNNNDGIYVGRFQPFHEGHQACILEILKKHDKCHVYIREINEVSERNPFLPGEVRQKIFKWIYENNLQSRVKLHFIEDFNTIYIGRDVGYGLIQLSESLESISATDIRAELYLSKNKK